MGKKANARVFGQDLMRGEHVLGNSKKAQAGKKKAKPGLTWVGGGREQLDDVSQKILAASASGTSIFDPVLAELLVRWFCPPDGTVLDPFAGGSVRGIVASKLGRPYVGIELSERQVAANQVQADRICTEPMPQWIVGDALDINEHCPTLEADFLFSCPPYFDLERYSDDPRDLSTMTWPDFLTMYDAIIERACAKLRSDRFAAFVVGDMRDKKGAYRGFPWQTVRAFEAAGMRLWNEAVLVTAAASLAIRARTPFEGTRKLGKTHQNVLIFVKGDAKIATAACGTVDVQWPEAEGEEGEGEPVVLP